MAPARPGPGGAAPPNPKRLWQAIILGTLVLVPAYWAMLLGLVDVASEERSDAVANPAAAFAFGFAVIPFVFVLVAFVSEHPRAPGAVLRAMGLSLAVGVTVSAFAGDAVSGIVAGVGAGGICALRPQPGRTWHARAVGVLVATAYTFVLVRTVGELALLPAPVFPLTALGLADHLAERREERQLASG